MRLAAYRRRLLELFERLKAAGPAGQLSQEARELLACGGLLHVHLIFFLSRASSFRGRRGQSRP